MPAAIQFHFDFPSPYGYIGAQRIEALAARHGRGVAYFVGRLANGSF